MLRISEDAKNLDVITCVVQRGRAEKVWAAARTAGAGGATIFFARGMGVRERMGLLGVAIAPEKEVITVVTSREKTERIYLAMCKAAQLNLPGQGIAYVQRIDRCAGLVLPGTKKRARKR